MSRPIARPAPGRPGGRRSLAAHRPAVRAPVAAPAHRTGLRRPARAGPAGRPAMPWPQQRYAPDAARAARPPAPG